MSSIKRLLIPLLLLVMTFSGRPFGEDFSTRLGRLRIYGQQHPLWCYAASAQMTASSLRAVYDVETRQCEIVEMSEGRTSVEDCCEHYGWCDSGGGAEAMLRDFFNFDVKGDIASEFEILSFARLKNELRIPRKNGDTAPVVTTFFPGGSKHQVVVRGVARISGKDYVYIINPKPVADPGGATPSERRGGEPRKLKASRYMVEQTQSTSLTANVSDIYGVTAR